MTTRQTIVIDRMFEFFGNKGFSQSQIKSAMQWAIDSYGSQTFGTLWDHVSYKLEREDIAGDNAESQAHDAMLNYHNI